MHKKNVLLAIILPLTMHATFSPYQFVTNSLLTHFLVQNTRLDAR